MQKSGYRPPAPPAPGEFSDTRIAILATRWNAEIVDALVAGAHRGLKAWGVNGKRVDEHRVPGAFELPLGCELLARSGRCHGIVALGCVIRGGTPHFEYVAGECARGLREVALRHALPVGFGVLTVDRAAQARARAGSGSGNKGYECALAVLEMVRLARTAGA